MIMSTTSEPPYLYLTTTGRNTGKPHEIEIWFVAYESNYYLTSGGKDHSDWVRNLLADPAISLRVGSRAAPAINGRARVLDNGTDAALVKAVQALMRHKYNWSDGFIVELRPA